jgi:hypothetical protein
MLQLDETTTTVETTLRNMLNAWGSLGKSLDELEAQRTKMRPEAFAAWMQTAFGEDTQVLLTRLAQQFDEGRTLTIRMRRSVARLMAEVKV